MREMLGTDWSPEIGEAWRKLLGEVDASSLKVTHNGCLISLIPLEEIP
jgi:hypothetical protein